MKKSFLFILCLAMIAGTSCRKKSENPEPQAYSTFTVNGTAKNYPKATNFTKDFCSTSTYCCRFSSSKAENADVIKLGIPGDPIVGHVYTTGESRFSCFYFAGGIRYDLTYSPFQVVFTVWEGQGGWAKGNFSGWFKSFETQDSVHIQNGYFQTEIWTIGTTND